MDWKKISKGSMFGDAEFELMRICVDPNLMMNHEETRKKMAELEKEIDILMKERPHTYEMAINILIQARNLMARLIGDSEIEVPVTIPDY